MTALRKITLVEANKLFSAMGLPVHQEGRTAGFHPTARGGRAQFVKAAHRIDVEYRFAGGMRLASSDLAEDRELREHFEWAVERAPRYGFVAAWNRGAVLEITRKLEAGPTEVTPMPAEVASTLAEDEVDARERRLLADLEDARATIDRAQGNFDRIAGELRDLRFERREARKENDW
ncbi:hypothetical protein [Kitasatospora indigofera]|uniref:hypothetical protein n=1 Tax=Kitasatospora indigofera TaxID=67307 RepID=UPI0033BDBEFC